MRCPLDVPHLNPQAALRAVSFRILILLGADAVLGTGAATIGKGVPPTHHRRLLGHIFTTKASLETAVQAYNADVASAEATYGPLADWDVSGITDMSYLFYNLKNFNADISNWETSGVTDMSNKFGVRSTPALNLRPDPSPARCLRLTPVTTTSSLFQGALAFNQPLSFDTSSVTNMRSMFSSASAFDQPLSLDTSSVTNMGVMFYVRSSPCPAPQSAVAPSPAHCMRRGCPPSGAPRPLYLTPHRTPSFGSRQGASAFNQPLSFGTSSVTNMFAMFYVRSSP